MIDRIEYSIIDQCNLNCAHCCHYAPVVLPYRVTRESFEQDMRQLSKLTHCGYDLGTLGILGGEPLLHPQFIQLCVIAREYLPYSRVRVTTNGLLLKKLTKQELCILRRFDIEILISKYRAEDDFEEMGKLLAEYGIIYKFCNNNELVQFCKYSIDETGSQNAKEMHEKCQLWQEYYTCHELRDGWLYPCSQIARAHTLKEKFNVDLPEPIENGINIYKPDTTLENIEQFLKEPVNFCKYCKVDEWNKSVGTWKKSSKSKDEFV